MAGEPSGARLPEDGQSPDNTMVATSEGRDPSRSASGKEKENAEDPRSPGTRSTWHSALDNAAQALGIGSTPEACTGS